MERIRASLVRILGVALLFVAGCTDEYPISPRPAAEPRNVTLTPERLADFEAVVSTMEPVAESYCRQMAPELNCDYLVDIHDDPTEPPNAMQFEYEGYPVILFNVAILADMQNRDEIAFVFGHEAAHHIEKHLPKKVTGSLVGGLLFGVIAGAVTDYSDQSTIETAMDFGSAVGSRVYSKDYELEADRLGAIITESAGYSAIRGIEYFQRIPDPGNMFLGTHPPNQERIGVVHQTVASL